MGRKYLALVIICLALAGSLAGFFAYRHKKNMLSQSPSSGSHYSYFSQSQFFDEAYNSAPKGSKPEIYPKAILINHHLLASNYIAEAFNAVATTAPVTVLLISPNHFDAGKGDVTTSAEPWKTPYGILQTDSQIIQKLSDQKLASMEEQPFEQEHGVSGIVAFIKKSLPNAKVVPLIFNNRMKLGQAQNLADQYQHLLPANTLIVGSFDFSHYLPFRAAEFHDTENFVDVESFNFESIYKLDIDSRPGLAFFLEMLKMQGDQNFHLLEHSNSAKLARKDILETTSYITGYFTKGVAATTSAETLLSLGPIIPSLAVYPALERRGGKFALTYVERLLYGQDETTAFSENLDQTHSGILKRLGVNLINSDYVTQLGSVKVEIIRCVAQSANRIRQLVDKGADVVVCQGAAKNAVEFYKNKFIVYAAGNFLDQNVIKNSGNSLAVGVVFQDHQLQIVLLPIGVDQHQLKLLIAEENDKVLAEMANNSEVGNSLRNQIKSGIIIINNFK